MKPDSVKKNDTPAEPSPSMLSTTPLAEGSAAPMKPDAWLTKMSTTAKKRSEVRAFSFSRSPVWWDYLASTSAPDVDNAYRVLRGSVADFASIEDPNGIQE